MPDEKPALGQPFVLEYANGDPTNPVIGIMRDPQAGGYTIPKVGDPLESQRQRYPNHKFVEVKPTESDRRVVHIYRRLPHTVTGRQVGDWSDMEVITTLGEDVKLDTSDHAASSQVRQVGGLWEGSAVKFPPANPANGVIASLYEENTDEKTGIVIEVTKYLVEADRAAAFAQSLRSANDFVEIRSGPTHRLSIVLRSKVKASSLPAQEVFYFQQAYNFPDVLDAMMVKWNRSRSADGAVAKPSNDDWKPTDAKSYTVAVSTAAKVAGDIHPVMRQGKTGQFRARRIVTYSLGRPPGYTDTSITPLIFSPSYATITIKTRGGANTRKSGYNSASVGYDSSVTTQTQVVGPFLHTGVSLTTDATSVPAEEFTVTGVNVTQQASASVSTGSLPWGGMYPTVSSITVAEGTAEMTLPPSSAPITPGTWVRVDDDLQVIFLNVYRRSIVEVFFQ